MKHELTYGILFLVIYIGMSYIMGPFDETFMFAFTVGVVMGRATSYWYPALRSVSHLRNRAIR